ncbi:MAG: phosphoribosylglycinamide formyltransferase [Chloroflexota bacterium]
MKLGFLASHNGSNMQAVIDACKTGRLKAIPAVVISNNSDSGALARAEREGIAHSHLSTKTHPDADALDAAILQTLVDHEVELVVLAGYMKKVGAKTLRHYADRIVNIHPALLPKFGGQGMYGVFVHQAVLEAGETETGVTIHLVNEEYDRGAILAQRKVAVIAGDSVESLAARVLETEHAFLVETLQKIVDGEIVLPQTT